MGWVYIIRRAAASALDQNFYKVGRTKEESCFKYLKYRYEKGFEQICMVYVRDCVDIEKKILKIYRDQFEQTDEGVETFMGDINRMKRVFYETIISTECIIRESSSVKKEKSVESVTPKPKRSITVRPPPSYTESHSSSSTDDNYDWGSKDSDCDQTKMEKMEEIHKQKEINDMI